MKTVYAIRHAKAAPGGLLQRDFDRSLQERGISDARMMAKRLHDKQVRIDAFISSPANRALNTCRLFTEQYGFEEKNIVQIEQLYHAPAPVFFDVISRLDEQWQFVAIFAHNPGITDFAIELCPGLRIDHLPTCAVFAVSADCNDWADFETAAKTFLFFDYPKSGM